MDAEEIRSRTDALVKRIYEANQKGAVPENCVILGDEGVFDSISILELVVALEREFGIEVTAEDVQPANFQDVPSLTRFISEKIARP